ncbi:MAG: hypothetical protein GXY84_04965 [Clostridiales bacterium]|nr:hypothetical protein [Clostridiales bacterium]
MKKAYEAPQILIKKTELYESVAQGGNCWSKMANTSGVFVTYSDQVPPYKLTKTYQFTPTAENCAQANTIVPDSIQAIMDDLNSEYQTDGQEFDEFTASYDQIRGQLMATNKTSDPTENFTFYFGSGGGTA